MSFENFEFYLKKKMKRVLLKPFVYWPAYQMGIIDEKGNKIREPEIGEKFHYNIFDELLRRIRVLFDLYVPSAGTKRFKVFKSFIEDGFIDAVDEEWNFRMEKSIICEDQNFDFVEPMIKKWLVEKFYA